MYSLERGSLVRPCPGSRARALRDPGDPAGAVPRVPQRADAQRHRGPQRSGACWWSRKITALIVLVVVVGFGAGGMLRDPYVFVS